MNRNFLVLVFIFFSFVAVASSELTCPCYKKAHVIHCYNPAPSEAYRVNLSVDFKKMPNSATLFKIEPCESTATEINKKNYGVNKKVHTGTLTLILCNKENLLDEKDIEIKDNYNATCLISNTINCKQITQ